MSFIYSSPNVLANGAIINGFCHIYQSTIPTLRPNGSALVVGDRWYNPTSYIEGYYNGTYWLSIVQTLCSTINQVTASGTSYCRINISLSSIEPNSSSPGIFIHNIGFVANTSPDTTNRWDIACHQGAINGQGDIPNATINLNYNPGLSPVEFLSLRNTTLSKGNRYVGVTATKFNSAPTLTIQLIVTFSYILN